MTAVADEFDVWFAENARCGTCRFFQRGLFSGRCVNAEILSLQIGPEHEETDEICGEGWDPVASLKPEMDAVINRWYASQEWDDDGE